MSVIDYEGDRFERELQLRVNEVLHYIWDPIGVRGVPEARDEYDTYVPAVYSLLQHGATAEQLAAHLDKIATERMGFGSNLEKSLYPAKELIKWRGKLLRLRPEILG